MKKILLEILLGLTLPAVLWYNQAANLFFAEQSINKQVSFSITRDSNYNEKAYDMASATVRVIIFKVRDNKQTILWNKIYGSRLLKNFPVHNQQLSETVTVHNVSDRKEKLFVTYMVTYNNKGSVMELENGTTLSRGIKQDKVEISI